MIQETKIHEAPTWGITGNPESAPRRENRTRERPGRAPPRGRGQTNTGKGRSRQLRWGEEARHRPATKKAGRATATNKAGTKPTTKSGLGGPIPPRAPTGPHRPPAPPKEARHTPRSPKARNNYPAAGRGSAVSSRVARPRWVMMDTSRVARASTAERRTGSAGACWRRNGMTSAPSRPRASTTKGISATCGCWAGGYRFRLCSSRSPAALPAVRAARSVPATSNVHALVYGAST